ncbi:MAG: hypothetical protein P8L45_04570, partial [Longimicrobiales bacterium]|nr:hypothetical protein [Longimicrobiales bacterium]
MTGDRWTFLVMREQGDPVQQYSLSSRTLKLLAGAGIVAVMTVVTSGAVIGTSTLDRMNTRNLEVHNDALATELVQFQSRIADLESSLDRVAENDAQFRNL